MSKPIEPGETITGRERRRRYIAEDKARLLEKATRPVLRAFAVARLHGVFPSLLSG